MLRLLCIVGSTPQQGIEVGTSKMRYLILLNAFLVHVMLACLLDFSSLMPMMFCYVILTVRKG